MVIIAFWINRSADSSTRFTTAHGHIHYTFGAMFPSTLIPSRDGCRYIILRMTVLGACLHSQSIFGLRLRSELREKNIGYLPQAAMRGGDGGSEYSSLYKQLLKIGITAKKTEQHKHTRKRPNASLVQKLRRQLSSILPFHRSVVISTTLK